MKKELKTPLKEAIDFCNIQRKQYQHITNKQLLTSNMSTFSTRPVTRRKRRSWGEAEVNLEIQKSSTALKIH